jgi:hypothetical protein
MRKIFPSTLVAVALLALAGLVPAQPGPPASAPGAMMGGGPMMHGGGCCGAGWRAGPRNTTGWSMMTPAERDAHHEKMRGMKSHDECRAYMDQHHAEVNARAKERGAAMPARGRNDPCAWFKKS